MRSHLNRAIALSLILTGCWALATTAQELPGPAPTQVEEDTERYEFMPHAFGVNGVLQEIYIKLDSYTGKTWRFHASSARWTPIPEPASPEHPREASEQGRYSLLTHDYYDTQGEEQELIMRVDHKTGFTWTYRGANGTWKDVGQDE